MYFLNPHTGQRRRITNQKKQCGSTMTSWPRLVALAGPNAARA
jgi:hypothetical protein